MRNRCVSSVAVFVVATLASATLVSTLAVGAGGADPAAAEAAACMPPLPSTEPVDKPLAYGFHPVDPVRLLDTRQTDTPTGPGCVLVLDVATTPSVPSDARALALNITTIDAPARGYVTVYPCGSTLPSASNVNPRVADATANSVLVQLDDTRQVCLFTLTSLHLIVDMTGWFGRFGAPYHAETSVRALDTRTALRPDAGTGLLGKGTELRLPVGGSVVHGDAEAVAINVTVTDPQEAGFVTVYPCGVRPPTSTVNFKIGEQRANHVVVGLDGNGAICVWGSADLHVIIDIEGWFGGEPDSGASFRPLLGTRVLDTRDGTGGVTGPLAMDAIVSFDPAKDAQLPIGSTVALNVIAIDATARGYITLYPCGIERPGTSAVNAEVGTESTNVAFVEVGADSKTCVYVSVPMHVVIDVVGTFGPGGPLHVLSLGQRTLDQSFTADANDYTTRCTAGANSITVHAEGAVGTVVSVAPSTASAPTATASVVDLTVSLQPNEALVVRAGRPGSTPTEYWVRCLPSDFPVLQTTRTEAPTPGWYLMDAAFPPGIGPAAARYLMILDNRSVPIWYKRVPTSSIDLTLMADGNLAWVKLLGMAFGSTPGGAYEVHRLDGTLVRSIATVNGPTDHHDIAELPNGDVILITYTPREHVDLTELGAGYDDDELVYDSHIEQIRPDGSLAWEWKSEDHIDLSEVTFAQRFPGELGEGVDLVHINGVTVAPDGDLIASARHTDAVYKISRTTGEIVLRIGGTDSDLTFVDDPLNGFARQHDAEILPNGNLRLFDNRTALGPPRAVEYEIDAVAGTATLLSALTKAGVTSSGGVGSVRSAGDGDTVVTWGGTNSPAFTEYDADGNELQTTGLSNRYPYRVDKQPLDAFDIDDLRATAGL